MDGGRLRESIPHMYSQITLNGKDGVPKSPSAHVKARERERAAQMWRGKQENEAGGGTRWSRILSTHFVYVSIADHPPKPGLSQSGRRGKRIIDDTAPGKPSAIQNYLASKKRDATGSRTFEEDVILIQNPILEALKRTKKSVHLLTLVKVETARGIYSRESGGLMNWR